MVETPAPGLSEYFSALGRRRRLLVGIAVPVALSAVVIALALPSVYRSSALVEITDRTLLPGSETSPGGRDELTYVDQYVSSLASEVLKSASLRRLLGEQQLYEDQDEEPSAAVARLRRDIDVQIVTAPILDPRTGREREVVTAFTAAAENSRPENAQAVATWLANEFLAANRRQFGQGAESTAEFYREEVDRMGATIADQEQQLAKFKNENFGRLPELTQVNLGVIDRSERDLTNLQQQGRELRQERVFLTSQLEQALAVNPQSASLRQLEEEYQKRAVLYDESHPDLVSLRRQIENLKRGGSAVGGSLQSQLDAQRSILTEARQRYSVDHPDVKRMQQAINALEARIAAGEKASTVPDVSTPVVVQLRTQLAAVQSQLASIDQRTAEVRSKLAAVERDIVASPEVERAYQTLTRDISTSRTKYEELLKRQLDAQISSAAISAGRMDQFRIVQSPPLPEEPAKPNRMGIIVIGLVLAVVLSFSGTLGVEMFDPTVRGMRDIRDVLSVSALAAIPQIQNSSARRERLKQGATATAALAVALSALFVVVRTW